MRRHFLVVMVMALVCVDASCKSGSCTVSEDADGNATITCPDGSTATIDDGSDCTATDNGDGTKTIACDDGTTITTADGGEGDDGTSCSVTDNGNGTSTIACDDGTSVTFIPGCDVHVLEFDTYLATIHDCPTVDRSLVLLSPEAPAEPIPALQLAWQHTCALRPEGRAVCWGSSGNGRTSPPAGPFVQLSSSYYGQGSCALRADGSAPCWGYNGNGQADSNPGPFVQITTGTYFNCGLSETGGVTCWGLSDPNPPGDFVTIAAADSTGCGLDSFGSPTCWGYAIEGMPEGPFVQLSLGGTAACGLRPDGSVECWGDDTNGEASPPPDRFSRIDSAYSHSCGVRTDGTLACWGSDTGGQATPPAGTFLQVDVGSDNSCALRSDLTATCWGSALQGKSTPIFPFTCPAGATSPVGGQAGLAWSRYNGAWSALPDFSLLTPVTTGTIANVGIPATVTGDGFGLVLKGWLNIPTTGLHELSLTSDDGSRWSRVGVAPDGGIAVDNDGNHPPTEKSASVCLGAGWHEIRIEYYDATAGEALSAKLDGAAIPGTSLVYVP